MKRTTPYIRQSESGFTIVELMMATLVFSVILVVITMGVLSFTSSYYKGINSSTTQNAARTIADTISQGIQFDTDATQTYPTAPGSPNGYFCAGGKVYMFTLGSQPATSGWGLYQQASAGSCAALTGSPSSNPGGKQLLGPHMRIVKMSITPATVGTNTFNVDLAIAYGDNDLLCDGNATSGPTFCSNASNPTDADLALATNVLCRPQAGSQFCDVSKLSTTVQQRIE